MSNKITAAQIDELLPQTQCGLCDYDGCKPYAQAIAEKDERIDRCPPGGTETLIELAALLNKDPDPYLKEMAAKAKPTTLAIIREDECIGCTKCIQACPTDAILGTGKLMHTVITDACTGCELCIEPCPVDCIDLISAPEKNKVEKKQQADQWRDRYQARQQRLERLTQEKTKKHNQAKQDVSHNLSIQDRKTAILAAVARAKAKKRP